MTQKEYETILQIIYLHFGTWHKWLEIGYYARLKFARKNHWPSWPGRDLKRE